MSAVTVKVKPKVRFTDALRDGRILHLDPKGRSKEHQSAEIPLDDALQLHARKKLEDFKNPLTGETVKLKPKGEGSALAQVAVVGFPEIQSEGAQDESTRPTGDAPATDPAASDAVTDARNGEPAPVHTIKHVAGGYWNIIKDGQPVGEKIKGKDNAQETADALNKHAALNEGGDALVQEHPVGPTAGADTAHGNGEREPGEHPEGGDEDDPNAGPA